MSTAYLIQFDDGSGLPSYYAPCVDRAKGSWGSKEDAVGFATEQDAEKFLNAVYPRMNHTCRVVPHTRG